MIIFTKGDNQVEKIEKDFLELEDYLNKAINYINENDFALDNELKKWNVKLSKEEIIKSLKLINNKVDNWIKKYNYKNDILAIELKDYDLVSKESALLLGECSLIDGIYIEQIDWIIGLIGSYIQKK